VRGAAAQIELDDAAELAGVRRAIFAAPRAPAPH